MYHAVLSGAYWYNMVPRGVSSTTDPYLTPILKEYLDGFFSAFDKGLRAGMVSISSSKEMPNGHRFSRTLSDRYEAKHSRRVYVLRRRLSGSCQFLWAEEYSQRPRWWRSRIRSDHIRCWSTKHQQNRHKGREGQAYHRVRTSFVEYHSTLS